MSYARERIELPEGQTFRVLRWNQSVREVECLLGAGRVRAMGGEGDHWHLHTEMELTWFESGSGTRFVGDHIGRFEAGDMVLLGERLPHYWHTVGRSSGVSVQWHFPESHPMWAFPENGVLGELFERAGQGLLLKGKTALEVRGLMRGMWESEGPSRLALLLGVLGRVLRAPEEERVGLSRRGFSLSVGSVSAQAMGKCVRHLVGHYREEVRLGDLLELSEMSRATFARQFKRHAGSTLSEFLNRLRLQAACLDLERSERTVLDIALSSGFTQISFFNRLFRREVGCSPLEFRARARARGVRGTGEEQG